MLTYVEKGTCKPWRGERLDGIAYPANIETLWTDVELKAIGLFRVQHFVVPAGKKAIGAASYAVAGDVAIETYGVVDFTANEKIAQIEGAARPSDRFIREALLTLAEQAPALKSTPQYQRLADAEAQIRIIRQG